MAIGDMTEHAPGAAGVGVALLLALKDGWRPALVKACAGLMMVFALRGVVVGLLQHLHIPPEAAGFLLGGFGVQLFGKLADTVQALEFAKPANAFIERWTGARTPQQTEVRP